MKLAGGFDEDDEGYIQEDIPGASLGRLGEEDYEDALVVAADDDDDDVLEIDDDQVLEEEIPTMVDEEGGVDRQASLVVGRGRLPLEGYVDEGGMMTQEDAYQIEQRGSPKKKRILIKSLVSTNNAIVRKKMPPPPRQPSSGRRRPPTAGQRLESARSNRRPPKSGGRIGPSTNTMKMLDPPDIITL